MLPEQWRKRGAGVSSRLRRVSDLVDQVPDLVGHVSDDRQRQHCDNLVRSTGRALAMPVTAGGRTSLVS